MGRDTGDLASMAENVGAAGKQWISQIDKWWTSSSVNSPETPSPPPGRAPMTPQPPATDPRRTPTYGYSARGRGYGYNRGRSNCNNDVRTPQTSREAPRTR